MVFLIKWAAVADERMERCSLGAATAVPGAEAGGGLACLLCCAAAACVRHKTTQQVAAANPSYDPRPIDTKNITKKQ